MKLINIIKYILYKYKKTTYFYLFFLLALLLIPVVLFLISPLDFSERSIIIDERNNLECIKDIPSSSSVDYISNTSWSAGFMDASADVDSNGNVYVGYINNSGSTDDLGLRKYDENGLLWDKVWNQTDDFYYYVRDIIVNSDDEIVVTVERAYNGGNFPRGLVVVKFDSNGDELWNYTFSYQPSSEEYAQSISIDGDGNLFLSGMINTGGNYLGLLLKLSPEGNEVWNRTINLGDDEELEAKTAVGVDMKGDIYVSFENSSSIFFAKYDTAGIQTWNRTFNESESDICRGVAFDEEDNIYMAAEIEYNGTQNSALIKYDKEGNHIFNITYESILNYSLANDIIFDNQTKHLYIAGTNHTGSLLIPSSDGYLMIVNKTGQVEALEIFDNDDEDNGYDLAHDHAGYIYLCGTISGSAIFAFLSRYEIIPGELVLSSDALNPAIGGQFTLSWNKPFAINNYTIYNYTHPITEINDSLNVMNEETANLQLEVSVKQPGRYYYIVEGFGPYGESISNSLEIYVEFIPEDFILDHNGTTPDTDGLFTLNWTESQWANNYSVYYCEKPISTFNDSVILIEEGITNLEYDIDMEMQSGEYYYIVVSFNDFGNNTSNNIVLTIEISPLEFSLSSDAGEPDINGAFVLSWTESETASNYLLYFSPNTITDIENSEVSLIYNGTDLQYSISEVGDGKYYYVVIAENEFGIKESNQISVTVQFPSSSDKDSSKGEEDPEEGLPWWLQAALTGAISATVGLIIKQSYSARKKRKEILNTINKRFDHIENKRDFLKENLKPEEWNKIKEIWEAYESQEISQKSFLKKGKASVGERFTQVLTKEKKLKQSTRKNRDI